MSGLDLTEAVEAASQALADSVGTPRLQGIYFEDAKIAVAAAAPLIEAQVRAQIAAEAVASDHDDAHRLLRDFAGGCGDDACGICGGAS